MFGNTKDPESAKGALFAKYIKARRKMIKEAASDPENAEYRTFIQENSSAEINPEQLLQRWNANGKSEIKALERTLKQVQQLLKDGQFSNNNASAGFSNGMRSFIHWVREQYGLPPLYFVQLDGDKYDGQLFSDEVLSKMEISEADLRTILEINQMIGEKATSEITAAKIASAMESRNLVVGICKNRHWYHLRPSELNYSGNVETTTRYRSTRLRDKPVFSALLLQEQYLRAQASKTTRNRDELNQAFQEFRTVLRSQQDAPVKREAFYTETEKYLNKINVYYTKTNENVGLCKGVNIASKKSNIIIQDPKNGRCNLVSSVDGILTFQPNQLFSINSVTNDVVDIGKSISFSGFITVPLFLFLHHNLIRTFSIKESLSYNLVLFIWIMSSQIFL